MIDAKKLSSLSKEEQKILVKQVITEDSPGVILKDFQTLIDFVKGKNLQLTGINNQLPMSIYESVNAKLEQPIELFLQRPQQKSYPNINGLYWLLRAISLAYIKFDGKKAILMIDEQLLQSWLKLNATERYFTLLENWLLHASVEILGEHPSRIGTLAECLSFFSDIPNKGMKIAGDKQAEERIRYSLELINLSLLGSFGLIKIEQAKPSAGKGWTIAKVEHTLFGDALLKYLYQINSVDGDILGSFFSIFSSNAPKEVVFGQWQSAFNPYFPEWTNNLILPKLGLIKATYIFKVFLGKKTYRQIVISTEEVLDSLANIILDAFEFDDRWHLHRFIYKDRFGRTVWINHPEVREAPFSSEVTVGEIPLRLGETMIYNFDFGDDWKFSLLLEAIEPFDPNLSNPKIITSQGKSPTQYHDPDSDWDEDESYY